MTGQGRRVEVQEVSVVGGVAATLNSINKLLHLIENASCSLVDK